MPSPHGLVPPPWWTDDQLVADRDCAVENFRRARMEEPLEAYLEAFEERQDALETLLERTVDLTQLSENALAVLSDPRLLEALRYIAGPPISRDDLKVVANAPSLSAKRLEADSELVQRLIQTVVLGLDRRRFPWIAEGREPREEERAAAILASAALIASQRVATDRRSEGKTEQEAMVELSGVFKLKHLNSAQARGLALFWAHDLAKMIDWIEGIKNEEEKQHAAG